MKKTRKEIEERYTPETRTIVQNFKFEGVEYSLLIIESLCFRDTYLSVKDSDRYIQFVKTDSYDEDELLIDQKYLVEAASEEKQEGAEL